MDSDTPRTEKLVCSWCRGDHMLSECAKMKADVERQYGPTQFQCNLDKSKCKHEWNNEGCNPTHCVKCGQDFMAYAFMEAP